MKPLEEREDPLLEIGRTGDFVVEDTISTTSHCSRPEDRLQKPWGFWAYLRDVERQRDAPRQSAIALSTDRDIEASLSVDESRDPVTQVVWDPIQPG
jgi:hypothetical protein